MTAAVLSRSTEKRSGLRPVNPQRDMSQVADLLEAGFADQLDDFGRRMVREMRAIGRAGWFGGILTRLIVPRHMQPAGFVWVEDGCVVANASLIAVEGHRRRWVLANVVVESAYRRQGIARALVEASVDKLRAGRAREIVLQVRHENRVAQVLYASMGFRPMGTRTTWRRPGGLRQPQLEQTSPIRRRKSGEWRKQYALAVQTHPEGLVWPFPLGESLYRTSPISAALSVSPSRHWVWPEQDCLLGSLTVRGTHERGGYRFILVVSPEARGRGIEEALMSHGLGSIPARAQVVLDYPQGQAGLALERLGFRQVRSLTWMRLELMDADAV